MLGKLCKHEIIGTGRMMAVFCGILAAATALVSVISAIEQRFESIRGILWIAMVLYAATVIVLAVISFVYLCIRFYQTMYSAQGYLTHTLPVKTSVVLNVKVLVSWGYLILTVVFCLLSFAIVCVTAAGGDVDILASAADEIICSFAQEAGMPKAAAAVFLAAVIVWQLLNMLLMFFAGSSIGQLFNRSKAAYGIAASIGLYYLTQIVSLLLIGAAYLLTRKIAFQYEMQWVLGIAVGIVLLWSAVYYCISRVAAIKHLNLE